MIFYEVIIDNEETWDDFKEISLIIGAKNSEEAIKIAEIIAKDKYRFNRTYTQCFEITKTDNGIKIQITEIKDDII